MCSMGIRLLRYVQNRQNNLNSGGSEHLCLGLPYGSPLRRRKLERLRFDTLGSWCVVRLGYHFANGVGN